MQSRPVMGDRSISPGEAAQDITRFKSVTVEWGGVIVETRNLETSSEIQIIAYPLQDNGKPDLDEPPTGRFIAVSQGYLETADYKKGRAITLSGALLGIRQSQ
jgi:outer membrane lipoprotein